MAGIFLFCTALSAAEWAQKIVNDDLPVYWVVESTKGPTKDQHCRKTIANGETIQSDFIDASPEECQKWALEKQLQDPAVEENIFVIVDERSSRDDTVLVQYYALTAWDFGGPERVPKESNKWYDFRVHYTEVFTVYTELMFNNPDNTFPQYFGCKEETTDEHGVFHAAKASELVVKKGSDLGTKRKS